MTARTQGTTPTPRSLWRHGDFLKYWTSQTFSRGGVQVAGLVLPLTAILRVDASPVELGMVNALAFAPYLLLTLPAGVWIDRSRKRGLLMLIEVGRVAVLAVLPSIALVGDIELWHVYAVAVLVGMCAVLFDVSGTAYLPSLVDRDQLLDGNSKLQAHHRGHQLRRARADRPARALHHPAPGPGDERGQQPGVTGRPQQDQPAGGPTAAGRAPRTEGDRPVTAVHRSDWHLRFLTLRSGGTTCFFMERNTVLPLFVLDTLGLGSTALRVVLGAGAVAP